ncbi:MAG: DEAD/DEAH box helicase [Turicibacter sp.]|nr:DEAD/DEAH box helicase [Turicibacter sp.]
MNFSQLNIHEALLAPLLKQGIKIPKPVQESAIPKILGGSDLIVQSQTGSGKTLAFILPLIQLIVPKNEVTQALVLAPTRELALQIFEVSKALAEAKGIKTLQIYGGKNMGQQLARLKTPPHLIIATPGRLLDHLGQGTVKLDHIKHLVIDEADQMILKGFKNEMDRILRNTPGNRQTLCFSATLPPAVKKLVYAYTISPELIEATHEPVDAATIRQEIVHTTDRQKFPDLLKAIGQDQPFLAIIFCRTKRRADELLAKMKQQKYNVAAIHSDIPQNKRERILKTFRSADLQFLIATDVAARGLDIRHVTHIYNFDVPEEADTYIHRIGRTGRAGADGYACMFVTPGNNLEFNMIERRLRANIPVREL